MLTVVEAIQRRRAIRRYRSDPVPEELLREILEAARLAPSGSNLQPWRFVIVKEPGIKHRVVEAANNQPAVNDAPLIIVCCADVEAYGLAARRERRLELVEAGVYQELGLSREEIENRMSEDPPAADPDTVVRSATANTHIAIAYMTLMATALGLGTVWVGGFDRDKVHEILGLPANILPVSLLPLGYPAVDPEPRPRLTMNEIILTP